MRSPEAAGWSWRAFWGALAALSVLLGTWGLATPRFASPDEPAHFLKAAAVVRGQWTGPEDPARPGRPTLVTVPADVAAANQQAACFAFDPRTTPDCSPGEDPAASGDVVTETQAGRYPPAYYAVAGLPTLAWPRLDSVYAVRGLSAALCAGLLAAAVAVAVGTGRRRLVLAVGVAVTPMVLFLCSGVNPNSFEVAAATAFWVAGAALVLDRGTVRRGPLLTAATAGTALVLSRPISPFWLLVVALVLVVLGGWRRARELLGRRAVQVAALVLAVAGALQAAWVLGSGALQLFGSGVLLPLEDRAEISLRLTDDRLRQMVGWFGWLDTPAPLALHLAWAGLLLALVVAGLRRSSPLRLVLLLAVAGAVVLVPVGLEVPSANEVGFYWQGRYTLPLAVGLPVLAALLPRVERPAGRAAVVLAGVLAAGLAALHVWAFAVALGRNTVGTGRGLGLDDAAWDPPLPPAVLLGAAVVGALAWVGVLLAAAGAAGREPVAPRQPAELVASAQG